jgi:hypothetical protein
MKDFMSRVDAGLLREQQDALFVAIDDAKDLAQYGSEPTEMAPIRQKHITMLEGLVNMIDAMLDEIEVK